MGPGNASLARSGVGNMVLANAWSDYWRRHLVFRTLYIHNDGVYRLDLRLYRAQNCTILHLTFHFGGHFANAYQCQRVGVSCRCLFDYRNCNIDRRA